MKKKAILFLLTGVFLCSFGIMSTVMAANTSDSWWSNQYRTWSPNDHTPSRKKDNKTSYYNLTSDTNIGYHTIWAALSDGTDVSSGRTYRSRVGNETFLYNLAVEKKGSGVKVRINSRAWNNGYANGYWSPDSIR